MSFWLLNHQHKSKNVPTQEAYPNFRQNIKKTLHNLLSKGATKTPKCFSFIQSVLVHAYLSQKLQQERKKLVKKASNEDSKPTKLRQVTINLNWKYNWMWHYTSCFLKGPPKPPQYFSFIQPVLMHAYLTQELQQEKKKTG